MGLTYEQHEMRSLHLDYMERSIQAAQAQLASARGDHQRAKRAVEEWETYARRMASDREVAELCGRFVKDWREWAETTGAAVTQLEKELEELETQYAEFWS